jgi:hypothetical protein
MRVNPRWGGGRTTDFDRWQRRTFGAYAPLVGIVAFVAMPFVAALVLRVLILIF